MPTLKCAGCGANKEDAYLMQIEVAVGVTVDVCAGRGGRLNDCARKARAAVCCGCGRPFRGEGAAPRGHISGIGYEGQIACLDCRRVIGLGRSEVTRQAVDREVELKFAFFDGFRILGPGCRGGGSYERQLEFVRLLARVTGGRTQVEDGEAYRSHGYVSPYTSDGARTPSCDAVAEVTAAQYEALCEFASALSGILADVRSAGFAEGEDLLGKLASGQVTAAAYEDEAARGRKKEDR